MDGKFTRRGFLAKSAVALGTAVACELTGGFGLGNAAAVNALASQETSEKTMRMTVSANGKEIVFELNVS